MKNLLLLFLLLLCCQTVFAQSNQVIEGKILHKETKEPISYANIFNSSTQKGTISNIDGYFRIAIGSVEDEIKITFIGYETQEINLREGLNFYTILLEERAQLLAEIVVRPKDDSYLFDLIAKCRNKPAKFLSNAKTYYELKTFEKDKQIELVEGFYNVNIEGYDLSGLGLKTGRLALQAYKDRFFVSLESSKAIAMLKLKESKPYFPDSPTSLPKSKARRSFYLYLDKKYLNDNLDSIYVIDYQPKVENGQFYRGKIWVNKTNNDFIKATFSCEQCQKHPFKPLFPVDQIASIDFNITKTFTSLDGEMAFNHIDFDYTINYKSRVGSLQEETYAIKTNAVLYAFDFNNSFFRPRFSFAGEGINDYRRINAMPYNRFFWDNNDEYQLNDSKQQNELFYADTNSLTNKVIFRENSKIDVGLFEHPFLRWSEKRVFFRAFIVDTIPDPARPKFLSKEYNLAVKFFLDINTYGDSTNVLTAVVFDPYESFYYLPIDNKTHCFVNIFFDLCEIERRIFAKEIEEVKNKPKKIERRYVDFIRRFEKRKFNFLKAVKQGENEEEMIKWNDYIFEELGIDNIALFKPYEKEK